MKRIDVLQEIGFDAEGNGYAQIIKPSGREVKVSFWGILMKAENLAMLIRSGFKTYQFGLS